MLNFQPEIMSDIPEGLKGKGVPGLADNPAYEIFWAWRDRLYADFRKVGQVFPSGFIVCTHFY